MSEFARSKLQEAIDNYGAAYDDYDKMRIEKDKAAAKLDDDSCYQALHADKRDALTAALENGFNIVSREWETQQFRMAIDDYRVAFSLYLKAQKKKEKALFDLQTQMRYSSMVSEKSEALISALEGGFQVKLISDD